MKWLINVPVWGERYRRQFIERGLPSIRAAAEHAGLDDLRDLRWLIQTDEMDWFERVLPNVNWQIVAVPPGKNAAERLGNASRLALSLARPLECVMMFNADMTISRETFAACERRFSEGKLFVTAHGMRVRDSADPPVGVGSVELLNWGWDHRHHWVDDCKYGVGHVAGPAIVVFEQEQNVVAHCFSLQCLAVHKTREIVFTGPTCDELIDAFTRDEVHVVTSPDELAIVESCSPDMFYDRSEDVLGLYEIVDFAPIYASTMMAWQFGQQVVIKGERLETAQGVADSVLRQFDHSKHPARLMPYLNSQGRIQSEINRRRRRWPRNWREVAWIVPQPVRRLVPRRLRQYVLRRT